MLKTNISIREKIVFAIACFVATCVFMLSVHAKDIAHYAVTPTPAQITYQDISAKAVGELHDHVDKQVLKTFAKMLGDNISFSRGRDNTFESQLEEDPGILARLQETLLLWRVYASLPFAVA